MCASYPDFTCGSIFELGLAAGACLFGVAVKLNGDFQPKPVPVMAVYPSRKQLSPKVRALVDIMGEAWGKAV